MRRALRSILARRALASTAVAALAFGSSCRGATELTVTVSTDAKCTDIHGVAIAVGQLGSALETRPAATFSMQCDPATGRVGAVVVVPSGSANDEIAIRATAGFGKSIDTCVAPFGPGCIVARRALRFIPHTPLYMTMPLSASCEGIPCDATSTCQGGQCVDPHVDPSRCTSPPGCDLGGAAPVDAGAPIDATLPPIVALPAPHPLAQVGDVPAASGTAQQQHLLWATHSARWWLFSIDASDQSVLKTRWSTDMVDWTSDASLTLADKTANEGRNFSVAYADIAGKDVVHLVSSHHVSGDAAAYHARATIDQAAITFAAETSYATIPGYWIDQANPDGTVAAIASDGHVYAATGWINERPFKQYDTIANMDVFASTTIDDGTAAGPLTNYVLHAWVPNYTNNRALVALGGGQMLAVWPVADTTTDSSDLSWSVSSGGWATNATLFGKVDPTAPNDWSVCPTDATTAHAVRRTTNGGRNDTFEHARFDTATGAWKAGGAIPSDAGVYGSGIVLLTNGTKLILFALASDTPNSVRYTTFSSGAWSAWASLVGSPARRAFLSGSGCGVRTHAAITWTEGSAAPYAVTGADVTGLF